MPWLLIAMSSAVVSLTLSFVALLRLFMTRLAVTRSVREATEALAQVHRALQEEAKKQSASSVDALRVIVLGRNDEIIARELLNQRVLLSQLSHHVAELEQHARTVEFPAPVRLAQQGPPDAEVVPDLCPQVQPAYFWRATETASQIELLQGTAPVPLSKEAPVHQAFLRLAGLKTIVVGVS